MRDIENLSISEVRKVSEANRLIKKEFHPDRLLYLTRDELSTAEAATLAGNSPRSRPGSYQHDHPWTPFNTISKNYQNENKNLAYHLPHQ